MTRPPGQKTTTLPIQLGPLPACVHQNKMIQLLLLLLFCHVSSPVTHSLKFFLTASTGVPNFPEFVGAIVLDEIMVGYCDTNKKIAEPKQEWVKTVLQKNPQHVEWYSQECFNNLPQSFKAMIHVLRQRFNQSEGVHIFQRFSGCEWDDETGEAKGFNQYGYDGEDFISFDLKTLTWIAPTPQAVITKHRWEAEKARTEFNENYLTQICPMWLKMYVNFTKSFLLRTVLPSVSLLQKSPSSPVSCHATGFHPDRAMMFWRKDGKELHEDVDIGEILPNHDGSFQMTADLKLSSVAPEDWRRYDCVFQLSGVNEPIVTRLDKDVIRTNCAKPIHMIVPATVVPAVVFIAVIGFFVYKKKKARCPPASPDNVSELSEKLSPT